MQGSGIVSYSGITKVENEEILLSEKISKGLELNVIDVEIITENPCSILIDNKFENELKYSVWASGENCNPIKSIKMKEINTEYWIKFLIV